jgi:hypothetical protein
VLEDRPLDLGGGAQVEPPGQGQHHTPLAARLLNPHRRLPSAVFPSFKTTILRCRSTKPGKTADLDVQSGGKLTATSMAQVRLTGDGARHQTGFNPASWEFKLVVPTSRINETSKTRR